MEAVGTLAGGIAHDFHNLLNVISGYSRVALADAQAEDRASTVNDLTQVIGAAERASKLTNQLLAFSRKQVLQPTTLDLGEVVESIAPMFERVLGRHVELRVVRGDDLPPIVADRGQLEQVLMNLIVNARDAMPAGGVITVTTSVEAGSVSLTVSDTGEGMTDEVRERVFEPFFTTKEVGKGTGLGLSTVYGIVNQSGGTISVQSVLGEGTTFTMLFPAAAEALVQGEMIGAD
jgi:signal transduction histidine kinase